MERFTLLISGSQVELGFYAREHREGDAFIASYYGLLTDVQGVYFCCDVLFLYPSNFILSQMMCHFILSNIIYH